MPLIQPRVAVLMAAYNGTQWIGAQLDTIQAQSGVAVHIFISIDASSDGTEDWCERYAQAHGNVTLLPASEACGGAAQNFFRLIRDVDVKDFDFVALSDQDDLWHEDKLNRACSFLTKHSVAGYSTNVTAFWPDGKTVLVDKAQPQVEWDHFFEAAGPGCTYVLSKQFTHFLRERIKSQWVLLQNIALHDWYIYALARSNGYKWHIDSIPSMQYRQHSNNIFGANVGIGALVARYKKFRSGWWLSQVTLIESIVNQTQEVGYRPNWRGFARKSLIILCLRSGKCRRRRRDQIFFCVLCFTAALTRTAKDRER